HAGGAPVDEEDIPQIAPKAERESNGPRPGAPRPPRSATSGMTRLFVGAGREGGVRPGDLVGAITGESSLSGRHIGAIEIAQRFSLVEVPDAAADEVVEAMRGATIRGKRATVRRERDQGGPPRR
ncbi:MAG: DbpA RNA binding domain-containing protein, partial [Actinomycetota bacterium]|nr:DbpA RNA binding domain-containing protein [Actinomycetota bacterium]